MQSSKKIIQKVILAIIIFGVLVTSCSSPTSKIVTPDYAIQPLSSVKNHYQDFQLLSSTPNVERKELDKIQFPNKKYELLMQLFDPAYLTRGQIEKLKSTIQPPANSSEQTKAELDFLLKIQNSRTPKMEQLALDWNEIVYVPIIGMRSDKDLFFEGAYILGEDCNAQNYPATKKLLGNIMKEMRIMEFTAKNHFLRARPRQLSKELQPLVKMNTPSFASGHTLWAYLQAYVWAELIPAKGQEFLDLAYEIGYSREILGVHYPSDEEAARQLSHKLFELMWQTDLFQEDFKAAKAEWE